MTRTAAAVALVNAVRAAYEAGVSDQAIVWLARESVAQAVYEDVRARERREPAPILYNGRAPATDLEQAHAAGYAESLGEAHEGGEHAGDPHPQCHFCYA